MMHATDLGTYYRIPADTRDLNYGKYFEKGSDHVGNLGEYHSHNTHRLNEEELRDMLINLHEIQDELKEFGVI
jgi:UDP-glucose 4-epimerase